MAAGPPTATLTPPSLESRVDMRDEGRDGAVEPPKADAKLPPDCCGRGAIFAAAKAPEAAADGAPNSEGTAPGWGGGVTPSRSCVGAPSGGRVRAATLDGGGGGAAAGSDAIGESSSPLDAFERVESLPLTRAALPSSPRLKLHAVPPLRLVTLFGSSEAPSPSASPPLNNEGVDGADVGSFAVGALRRCAFSGAMGFLFESSPTKFTSNAMPPLRRVGCTEPSASACCCCCGCCCGRGGATACFSSGCKIDLAAKGDGFATEAPNVPLPPPVATPAAESAAEPSTKLTSAPERRPPVAVD